MRLFLYIHITKEKFHFSSDLPVLIRSLAPDVTFFDVDNYSDNVTVDTALKAIRESTKTFIFIEAEPGPEPGKLLHLISKITKLKCPVVIFYQGAHEMLDKLMITLKRKTAVSEKENLAEAVRHFF
ncbi:hypothetical protein C900_01736 [Fulvivirga imtechensis AK7]|uniref:Response regulatory domain-containing protein n=1 Tax=Fulvivirga imtechensis AK7 TaxID=1237149 RepID=L8JYA1_9BACT|nr:hypothetical protein [Fulvivirga imtechensis]ELR72182.1 hypothetical protein C900_01736 [Fulvivirga imtechensis AK7]